MRIIDKILFNALSAFAAVALLTACDEGDYDTGWTPVPPYEGAQRVYFEKNNPTSASFILSETDDLGIYLTVMRNDSTDAASVPVTILEGSEYFSVPAEVDFMPGQSTTTLRAEFTDTENAGITRTLRLQLEDTPEAMQYTNNQWVGTCIITRGWIPYYKNIRFYWSNTFADFYQDIDVYDGTADFRIANFLNSGQDLKFKLYHPTQKTDGASLDIITPEMLSSLEAPLQCGIIIDEEQATFDGSYWYTWNIDLHPTLTGGASNGDILAGEGMYGSGPKASDYRYLCYMWIGIADATATTAGSFCFYINGGYNYFTWYHYAS
ncbi:MAG: hypothetical protein LBN29_07765 [Mediterranea sp.]|jgi:hypothetical protein|nr:hypothetical protein [Mediterranea sp.]